VRSIIHRSAGVHKEEDDVVFAVSSHAWLDLAVRYAY
jgi:hypothetical protein